MIVDRQNVGGCKYCGAVREGLPTVLRTMSAAINDNGTEQTRDEQSALAVPHLQLAPDFR
jgi:hypothetical protein